MRFVFSPPADEATELLDLPWEMPLEEWTDARLVEVRQRGISRHVVRFAAGNREVYALKEITEDLARREYRLLRRLSDLSVPAVDVLGVVVDRPGGLDAVLVTRLLAYSTSYRALFAAPRGHQPTERLLDALVELLVRLHLAGLYWGDCSLSNALFRLDAGALEAYLVDAETAELHPSLTNGQRAYDVELARTNVGGELLDLQAGQLLPDGIDPIALSAEIPRRYHGLWDELTREDLVRPEEQRFRIASRIENLNEHGFDVDEVEIISGAEGNRVRLRTRVAEPGHHRRKLFQLTGLSVQENQARRMLNDIASFRGYLENREKRQLPEPVVASRWLAEVYDPVRAAIPPQLRDRLAPAEVFHEILDHRWYLSEQAGLDVGTTAAAQSYFATVLPDVPEQLTSGSAATVTGRPPDNEDGG